MSASSMAEVVEDLSSIFKVRREKTAEALAKEFVSFYEIYGAEPGDLDSAIVRLQARSLPEDDW